jgi:hypothetical protein
MKAPQIILIVLYAAGLLLAANNHKQPRTDENFWTSLISCAIVIGLLIWGGFFK